MTFNVEPFSKQSFELGEGPHWYNDKLYFVDILDGTAGTLDSNGVYHLLHKEKDNIVSAVFPVEGDDQSIAFSTKLGVYSLNLTTGNKKLIDSLEGDGFRFNDAKCDSKHRLWIGTMGLETSPGVLQPEKGAFYTLSGEGKLEKRLNKVSLSNGICWSLDDKQMYYIDSYKRHIYCFDYDIETGSFSNQKILVDMNKDSSFDAKELPDGMTIDINGNLWVALFFGGRIVNIDSKTGKIIKSIEMPALLMTSVCFGGPNLDVMYATSAKIMLDDEQKSKHPFSGYVFKITSADNSFKGFKPNFNIQPPK